MGVSQDFLLIHLLLFRDVRVFCDNFELKTELMVGKEVVQQVVH